MISEAPKSVDPRFRVVGVVGYADGKSYIRSNVGLHWIRRIGDPRTQREAVQPGVDVGQPTTQLDLTQPADRALPELEGRIGKIGIGSSDTIQTDVPASE